MELFSNLNRRDFAVLEEDPDDVTTDQRRHVLPRLPDDRPSATDATRIPSPISKCGAYRINARYRVNGGDYVYYTDTACAATARSSCRRRRPWTLTMYELNPHVRRSHQRQFLRAQHVR